MYVPKSWHWIGPISTVLSGFFIRQQFGAHWDVFLLVQLPLTVIASEWGAYLWQAGVAYQKYVTAVPEPEHKEIIDWHTSKPVEDLQPINREMVRAGNPAFAQVVELPKFNLERRFAIDILRMYDFDPITQKHVDMTEEKWVLQKKQFSQKPFANMKKKWEHFGVIKRKNEKKNSKFIVNRREAVALIASGNPLPEWSPPLSE